MSLFLNVGKYVLVNFIRCKDRKKKTNKANFFAQKFPIFLNKIALIVL